MLLELFLTFAKIGAFTLIAESTPGPIMLIGLAGVLGVILY